MTRSVGKVYLVGAGPGDESLITVRGLDLVKRADAIVYDRLAGEGLLEHRKPACELVYVGKSPEGHTLRQEEINRLLARLAGEGRQVVRLKGGDPFVFGRGGEEALEMRAQGIPFEVVPGVTSALSGPAAAGIPVTHRGVSASFAVATGHEDPTKGETEVEWEKLASSAGTLVILMGVGNLPDIARRIMAGGRSPETPVAVIRRATTPHQEVLTSTLGRVADDVAKRGIRPPAVIVVGDVVRLRERLAPRQPGPLAGKRVLITRPAEQAGEFAALLEAQGAEPIVFPLIRIAPTEDVAPLRDALRHLDSFDWLFFTSANGARIVAPHLKPILAEVGGAHDLKPKVAAVGPRTAQECEALGLEIAFMPKQYAVESIVKEFPEEVAGKRMLLLRAREANPALPEGLRKGGAEVEEIAVYGAEPVKADAPRLRRMLADGEVDVVTLMSSSTAQRLVDLLGQDAPAALHNVHVACLGHVTAKTFHLLTGREPDTRASVYTMQGLIEAMIEDLER